MSPILGIYASQISGHLSTNNFSSIATVTVGSGGASSISFTSIPSTYTHLQLRVSARTTSAANCILTFNGDTGSNYGTLYVEGTGSGVSAGNAAGTSFSGGVYVADTGVFTGQIIDILDYANTNKYKTLLGLTGTDRNGNSTWITLGGGSWNSASAITSITITNSFAQYSTFALYGVK